ncbi:MAG: BsuPI-related putative proteinase inhibitor [bacterium]|nr:BsuPI-related putative proteinase inhibitor [bacterium]
MKEDTVFHKTLTNPNTRLIILVIDLLIILGMFAFIRVYYKHAPLSVHTIDDIQYYLLVKPAKNKSDYLFTFRVKNKQEETVTLDLSDSGCQFLVKQHGQELFRAGQGAKGGLTLNPNEEKTFSLVWDQRDQEGNLVEAGEYQIIARLNIPSPVSIATRIKVRE